MKIYRVTFETSVLVACDDEKQAEFIGATHLNDEVSNGHSIVTSNEHITRISELYNDETFSYPWCSPLRKGLQEKNVNEILESDHG